MLTLTGQLINLLDRPLRQGKDGKAWGGDTQAQLLTNELLDNGETRQALVDLMPVNRSAFEPFMGKDVSVKVRAYVVGKVVRFQATSEHPEGVKTAKSTVS